MIRLPFCVTIIIYFLTDSTSAKPAENTYSTKYDNFDVQGVLASKRLVLKYGDCLMERGSCPPEGRFLKGKFKLSNSFHSVLLFYILLSENF